MSRRVVCVAGCWGPKLRVQVACLASVSSFRFVEQVRRHHVNPFVVRMEFARGSGTPYRLDHDSPRVSLGKLCRSPRPRSG